MAQTVYSRIKASAPAQWFFRYSGVGQLRVFIRWFGWATALKFLTAKYLSRREPVQVGNSDLKAPVFLRPNTTDPFIYAEVILQRGYEAVLPAPPRLIVDAGANIGLASVFFSNRYPDAQIIAIEPSETNMALLRQNVAPYPNVHPKLAGLWPSSGPLRLVNRASGAWAFQVQPCLSEEADFQGITIPDILKENQAANQIDLLKIDIEGAEWPLLFDTTPDWLHAVNFVVMELHAHPDRGPFDWVVRLMHSYHLKLVHANGSNYSFSR